jgi:hypothetical protein
MLLLCCRACVQRLPLSWCSQYGLLGLLGYKQSSLPGAEQYPCDLSHSQHQHI